MKFYFLFFIVITDIYICCFTTNPFLSVQILIIVSYIYGLLVANE